MRYEAKIREEKNLDSITDKILSEENPTAEAVKALINVKDKQKGEESEIELKTDLTVDEIKIHAVLDMLNNVLEMDNEQFNNRCILSELITKKERKSLSKNRMSRTEIVTVAKHPEMDLGMQQGMKKEGFIRRFFAPQQPTGK